MALQNNISIAFTPVNLQQIDGAISQLKTDWVQNQFGLPPGNQMYSKPGNAAENRVEMVYKDCQATPPLKALLTSLISTNRLIGFDLYNTCLSVYNSVKFEAKENVPGTKAYQEKWSVQFPGHDGGRAKKADASAK